MEDLRRQRGPVRRGLTKALIELELELENEFKNKISVQQKYSRTVYQRDQLVSLDRKIDQTLIDFQASEEELAEEYDSVTDFMNRFSDAEVRVYHYFDTLNYGTESDARSAQRDVSQKTQYRLPKLEFKKFNGDAKSWLGFWSQFKQIDKDVTLAPEDKFQYLIQSTVEGSKAREVVESFPPSSENYPKVIHYFKERFGKEEILLEVYVRELLKLVLKNAITPNENSCVSALYDKLETQLRALDTLGVTRDKFAAMLYPLVESCLPEDVLRAWERNRGHDYDQLEDKKDRLSMLMQFLKREVDGELRISMARDGFGVDGKKSKPKIKPKPVEEIPTATELFSGHQAPNKFVCIFCEKGHPTQDCFKAPKLSLEEKRKIVQEKKACFVCLRPGHISKKCKASVRCQVCEKKHYVAMCPDVPKGKIETDKKPTIDGTALSNQIRSTEVILQTLLVRVKGIACNHVLRALLDTGSQKSYMSECAAKALRLKCKDQVKIAHSLFGGGQTEVKEHRVIDIHVESLINNFSCSLSVLDQPVICGKISRVQDKLLLDELKMAGVELTDTGEGATDINLLFGADVLGKLYTGKILPTRSGPVAVETKLGWTVFGSLSSDISMTDSTSLVSSMISTDAQIADLWSLDTIGIKDAVETKSRQDLEQAAMDYFHHSTIRLQDGRFEVSLPWVEGHPVLASNEELAVRRLVSSTKKLEALGRFDDYQHVFDDWLTNGIIEEVPANELDNTGHYLPHRAIIKESSDTTKVRPVFDASAKKNGEASLNDCLEKGRNLLELIPNIIAGFRFHRIGLISDIEKAFLQISVKKEERDFLRFLWWEKGTKEIKKYRHCRVVFGVSSSPFLLAASLKMLLETVPEDLIDVASYLLKSLYVDNCVTSLKNRTEVNNFICKCVQIMSKGQFNLRGWVWNNCDQPEKFVPVLGLLWNIKTDEISLDLKDVSSDVENWSKRKVLSLAHKLFDPIGFTSPVSLVPKLLLQEAWKLKIGWDQNLPENLSARFVKWSRDLPMLKEVTIPRWIFEQDVQPGNISLHLFTDASKYAYAAAVFIRAEYMSGVSVQLLQAKSRVAPVKAITIPRLELLGCCIGARLATTVKLDHNLKQIPSYYWTDSSNALCWIQRQENWATFVGNRVREIRELTDPENWRHLPGSLNPADLPSRGCSAKQLLQSRWWEGPIWLKKSPELWPKSEVNGDEGVVSSEKKSVATHLVVNQVPWYAQHFSNYVQIVRLLAWIQRYKHNCQNKNSKFNGDLRDDELAKGELWLIRLVQIEVYSDCELKSHGSLKQLNAEKDENGIWRLKTKIFRRKDTNLFRCPMILPSDHLIARRLIVKVHEELSHGGVQLVMSAIREKFWLTKTRKAIKQVIQNRVRDAAVFEVVGIDIAGPLYLRDRPKGWIVVYTCAVYRAVLISSLSTECFLLSLRRFIGRRGRPRTIYSDNGTNFVGTANLWKQVNLEKIRSSGFGSSHSIQPITWIFNPPGAPWWGGWWERIVRLLKEVLRKVLGRACLDFEEMLTILCDCEAVINARPLTYISDDVEDLAPLTPSMLLQELREVGIPDMDNIDAHALNKRVIYRQKIREDFRRRFRIEYLGMLKPDKSRKLIGEDIKPGDIVLVGSDNTKRISWPMARILEVFPGKDGVIRVAKIKTSNGELVRPIQRLYPFEVCEKDRAQIVSVPTETTDEDDGEIPGEKLETISTVHKTSRAGRRIKAPNRFD